MTVVKLVWRTKICYIGFSKMNAKAPPITAVKTRLAPTGPVLKSKKELQRLSNTIYSGQEKSNDLSNSCFLSQNDSRQRISLGKDKLSPDRNLENIEEANKKKLQANLSKYKLKNGASHSLEVDVSYLRQSTLEIKDTPTARVTDDICAVSVKRVNSYENIHRMLDKPTELTELKYGETETDMSCENCLRIASWKPFSKPITVIPKNLLDRVTTIVRLAYENDELISFNRDFYFNQEKHESSLKLESTGRKSIISSVKLDRCNFGGKKGVRSNFTGSKTRKQISERKQTPTENMKHTDWDKSLTTKSVKSSEKSRIEVKDTTTKLQNNNDKQVDKCRTSIPTEDDKMTSTENGNQLNTKKASKQNRKFKKDAPREQQRNENSLTPELNAKESISFREDISLLPPNVLNKKEQSDKGSFNLADLSNGILEHRYERAKNREKQAMKRNRYDGQRERRKPPNYFVSIQVSNPEIRKGISEVQNEMCEANEHLKTAMVSVAKLHLTIRVACLETEDHIARMVRALDQCIVKFNRDDKDMIVLDVKDVENFRNNVVFASVTKDESLSRVNKLSEILEECCKENDVPPSDGKGFNPHITIAKLSKVSFQVKKKIRKIEPSTYTAYKEHKFGKQLVTGLQLCSMFEPTDKTGYYHVTHVSPLKGTRNFSTLSDSSYTIADAAHVLVTAILSDAFACLKKTSL